MKPSDDPLDRLLAQLPAEPPPADLASCILQMIYTRRRREVRLKLALSAALAILGAWLAWPGLATWSQEVALPVSGVSILFELSQIILNGLEVILANMLNAASELQSGFGAAVSPVAWLGLVALALSALLALGFLLPRVEN